MIWAKEEKKRSYLNPRVMLAVYTIGICMLSVAAFAETPAPQQLQVNVTPAALTQAASFAVTRAEAETRIAERLTEQGAGDDLQVSIVGRRTDELVRRSEPVVMEITELAPDANTNRFTATLAFSTEASLDKPAVALGNLQVAGRFEQMQDVPMVKFRMTSGQVITADDIIWQKMPSARLTRDTVLASEDLVGKMAVRTLTGTRAIKSDELRVPPVVTRQSTVHMNYKSANLSIQAVGQALEDGAVGDKIRVRNTSSGAMLEGIVTANGQVQILPAPSAVRLAVARVETPAASTDEPLVQ